MICRGNPSVSCCAGAWALALTPADMSADVDMSAALFVTERWSRPQSYPCFARVILDVSIRLRELASIKAQVSSIVGVEL